MDATLQKYIDKLNALNFKEMYEGDFFLTWDKSDDELEAVFTVADALRYMRENNISTKIFESGLGISLFRDNSTRTRFSFASACNLLGLEVQDLDEGKSQIAHGETVRETANMISFMADVIGIRDDMYIGKGHTYQKEVAEAVTQGHKDGVLEQKPTLVCYSGLVGVGRDPHSWVEITFDGVPYVFDVETEMSYRLVNDYITSMYWKTYEEVAAWSYVRTPEEAAAAPETAG